LSEDDGGTGDAWAGGAVAQLLALKGDELMIFVAWVAE